MHISVPNAGHPALEAETNNSHVRDPHPLPTLRKKEVQVLPSLNSPEGVQLLDMGLAMTPIWIQALLPYLASTLIWPSPSIFLMTFVRGSTSPLLAPMFLQTVATLIPPGIFQTSWHKLARESEVGRVVGPFHTFPLANLRVLPWHSALKRLWVNSS